MRIDNVIIEESFRSGYTPFARMADVVLKTRLGSLKAATENLNTWSRTRQHFPPLSQELVEKNIQRLSVTPNLSDNQEYALLHGAYIHDFEGTLLEV